MTKTLTVLFTLLMVAALGCKDKKSDGKEAPKAGDSESTAAGGRDEAAVKAKTTEAKQFVKKIYDGARAYYMEPPAGDGLSMAPPTPQFPESVGPTPALGECCKAGGKCAPSTEAWSSPSWTALQFSMDDPHYYSYEFKADNESGAIEALAYGDLDCDGTYSTFSIKGSVQDDGPPAAGKVEATNELE